MLIITVLFVWLVLYKKFYIKNALRVKAQVVETKYSHSTRNISFNKTEFYAYVFVIYSLYFKIVKALPLLMRIWCNGSTRVSKTFNDGSIPSVRALFLQFNGQNGVLRTLRCGFDSHRKHFLPVAKWKRQQTSNL